MPAFCHTGAERPNPWRRFMEAGQRPGAARAPPLGWAPPAVSANPMETAALRRRDEQLLLEFGEVRLELDAACGARVRRLALGSTDLLIGEDVHPTNWGSTYWTSPQDDWGWPPVAAIDHEPYTAVVEGDTVSLRSGPALAGTKRLSVTKRFTPRAGRQALEVEYVVRNLGDAPFSIASWEISRVPAGGLSFFAAGAREYTLVGPHTILPTTKERGVTWFDHRRFEPGQGAKLNADSSGGWLAHVVRGPEGAGADVLFLKSFDVVPLERQAPGEGVVELYADETGAYVEVENQGPFDRIEPGATSVYRVTWLVRALPRDMKVAIGSADLMGFVQALVDGSE